MHRTVCSAFGFLLAGILPSVLLGRATARPASPRPPTVEILVDQVSNRAEFRIHGLDPDSLDRLAAESPSPDRWTNLVPVSVDAGTHSQPPMLGSYRVSDRNLVFVPRYPLERSISKYTVDIDASLLAQSDKVRIVVDAKFAPDRPSDRPNTTVQAVYPSRGTLPENTLRFYLVFSAAMSRGEAYDHIRLLDGAGRPIADPFLELGEELWSVDGKRFTLLFDPGRIKRGLKPREEVGPVLEAGKRYTLVIEAGWLDARGNPLGKEFRKPFRVGPADETVPDPRKWTIQAPRAGTRDPLMVRFPEPLDRALAARLIFILGPMVDPVRGVVRIESEETVWTKTPEAPWQEGAYQMLVGADLEDLAGNSVRRRFDVDLFEPIMTQDVEVDTIGIPFRIER